MKILRRIEAFAQITALVAAGAFAIATLFKSDFFIGVVYIQLWIGVEQYLSSAISCVGKSSRWREKALHLKLSTIYLVILFSGLALANVIGTSSGQLASFVIVSYVLILPWLLAIYYAIITWKEMYATKHNNGHFLPHTSF